MTPSEHSVEVTGVSKRFGDTAALSNVSLSVAPAELFGIVGPDGGGKTTLFRILATLLLPDTGTARVLGRDVVAEMWELRQRLGYMPGRFSLYGDLSVEENLAFFASVFGTTVDAGRDIIAPIYAQLEPFRTRRAAALSGGMKQKLALCCALVHRPELLLLDEPTTGVDAVSRSEFWDLLKALRASGLSIVVSTPYMDEASRCDRIALMQGGVVLAIDAPAQIGARYPRHLFAVSGQPRHRVLGALRALPHTASAFAFGDTVHCSDARTDVDSMVAMSEIEHGLLAAGVTAVRIQPIAPGIEDVFIELMGSPAVAAAA
jgi:ABC-2 type transport system ATP-binding protein